MLGILFCNRMYKNFIDLCYYFSHKFYADKTLVLINNIIKKYEITHLIKKEHKHNNKKNNKNIKWII